MSKRYFEATETRPYHLFFDAVSMCSPKDVAALMFAEGWADDMRPTLLISTRGHEPLKNRRLRCISPFESKEHPIEWLKFAGREGKDRAVLVIDAEPVFHEGRIFPTIKATAALQAIVEVVTRIKLHAVHVVGDEELLSAVRAELVAQPAAQGDAEMAV